MNSRKHDRANEQSIFLWHHNFALHIILLSDRRMTFRVFSFLFSFVVFAWAASIFGGPGGAREIHARMRKYISGISCDAISRVSGGKYRIQARQFSSSLFFLKERTSRDVFSDGQRCFMAKGVYAFKMSWLPLTVYTNYWYNELQLRDSVFGYGCIVRLLVSFMPCSH